MRAEPEWNKSNYLYTCKESWYCTVFYAKNQEMIFTAKASFRCHLETWLHNQSLSLSLPHPTLNSCKEISKGNFYEKISRFPPAAYEIWDLPDCDSHILQLRGKTQKTLWGAGFLQRELRSSLPRRRRRLWRKEAEFPGPIRDHSSTCMSSVANYEILSQLYSISIGSSVVTCPARGGRRRRRRGAKRNPTTHERNSETSGQQRQKI